MPVIGFPVNDANGTPQDVAVRKIGGINYQIVEPPVTTFWHLTTGSSDAQNIVAGAQVLRTVRIHNPLGEDVFVQLHDSASTPTPGSGVVYHAWAQAGQSNPYPRVDGGGREFTNGISVSFVTTAGGATPIGAGVLVEIEYHASGT